MGLREERKRGDGGRQWSCVEGCFRERRRKETGVIIRRINLGGKTVLKSNKILTGKSGKSWGTIYDPLSLSLSSLTF